MKHQYFLTTGLASYGGKDDVYESDKEAWNALSKPFDACYKTGGHVIADLKKMGIPLLNLHEKEGLSKEHAHTTNSVCTGFISFDWDGNPWNNLTNCKLCNTPIPPKQYRDIGYCKFCEQIVDSLFAWEDSFGNCKKQRIPSIITQELLDRIKEISPNHWWKTADFLIRDGTMTIIERNVE